jgi:hypothetical protein
LANCSRRLASVASVAFVAIHPNRGDRIWAIGIPLAKSIAESRQPLEGSVHPGDPRLRVIVKAAPVFNRDEHRHRSVVALDDEARPGGGLVQDAAK